MMKELILVQEAAGKKPLLRPKNDADMVAFQHFTNGAIAIYQSSLPRVAEVAKLHGYILTISTDD